MPLNTNSKAHLSYERHDVAKDGNCGYTAFGIQREYAHELLYNNAERIKHLITSAVKEALLTQAFLDYLKKQKLNVVSQDLRIDQMIEQSDNFATQSEIIKHYIDFDVKHKQIDSGWAHPAILQALAEIQGIKLYIWQLDDDEDLMPHTSAEYAIYHPRETSQNQRIDLLFVKNNHFERLDLRFEKAKFFESSEAEKVNDLVNECLEKLEATKKFVKADNENASKLLSNLEMQVIARGLKAGEEISTLLEKQQDCSTLMRSLNQQANELKKKCEAIRKQYQPSQVNRFTTFQPCSVNVEHENSVDTEIKSTGSIISI